jgi:hypothetical protein
MCQEGVVTCFAVLLGEKCQLLEYVLQVGKCYAAMLLEVIISPRFYSKLMITCCLPVVVTGTLGSDRKLGVTAHVTLWLSAHCALCSKRA